MTIITELEHLLELAKQPNDRCAPWDSLLGPTKLKFWQGCDKILTPSRITALIEAVKALEDASKTVLAASTDDATASKSMKQYREELHKRCVAALTNLNSQP